MHVKQQKVNWCIFAWQGVRNSLPRSCTSRLNPILVTTITLFNAEASLNLFLLFSVFYCQCYFPQHLIASVRTPLFLLNAAYDTWQVSSFHHMKNFPWQKFLFILGATFHKLVSFLSLVEYGLWMTLEHEISCFMAFESLIDDYFNFFSDSSKSCSTICWLPMELVWMQKRLCTLQWTTDSVSSR